MARSSQNGERIPAPRKLWIDLDNSPHVPFFQPIIQELERRGYSVTLTARNFAQVFELAKLHGLDCKQIGRHYGKNRVLKLIGLCIRAMQLIPTILRGKPDLAVSHGSRSQLIVSALLGIPAVTIADYEFARKWFLVRPDWVLTPEVIPDSAVKFDSHRILKYPGIKEDVYVPRFRPGSDIRAELGLSENDVVATVRPPAVEAHYHNPESEKLFDATLDFLGRRPDVKIVMLPRTKKQAAAIRQRWSEWFASGQVRIPEVTVDGLNLLWHSDLVISAGGTMNREAAALGVPVYSVFRGKVGAVDRYLVAQGRLVLVESVQEIASKIIPERRDRPAQLGSCNGAALKTVVDHLVTILEAETQRQLSSKAHPLSPAKQGEVGSAK